MTLGPRVLFAGCWLFIAAAGALAGGRGEALSTPELLLDLARDHGLTCQGAQTPVDVAQIRTLLRAAVRLNPRLSDAFVWLHELAVLRGDQKEAFETLRQLVAAEPGHAGAFARFLEAGMEAGQTVEQRVQWLEEQLAAGPAKPALRAMVHVQLGRLALARLDRPGARRQLDEALALDPYNPDAIALSFEALDPDSPPGVRLRAALRLLALSPFNVETAWEVGALLDHYGFHEDAEFFYDHATEIDRLSQPGVSPAGSHLLQLSRHALARGDLDLAIQRATQAIQADPSLAAEGGMFLHWLLKRQGREADARGIREQLARRFAEVREPRDWPVNEVAEAAWFYCTIDPQPQRALMLAENAAARVPNDSFALRVLGWAQLANLEVDRAQSTLAPLAGKDVYAAVALAKILKAAGDEETARRVVGEISPLPTAGPALDALTELGLVPATSQPAAQAYPRIAAALTEFDRAPLSLYREPGQFLQAGIFMDQRSVRPGEPWWLEFRLTNRARFPITLGPQWMVNPVFLLSFEMEGDRRRAFPELLTISLDQTRVLAPGATISSRRTVDLGPLRRAARLTPQQMQRVTVRALLDPLRGADGQWRPALAGQRLGPLYFNRLPANTSREALHALFAALTGDSDPARFLAIEQMAELLGERQRADLGRVNYRPEPISVGRIQQALLAGLTSESWELRVRTLDALQMAGLDARLLDAIHGCLDHPHWLVRLMAARLLGSRQGAAAASQIKKLADFDKDELVRALASSYLSAWEAQAASSQSATPAPAQTPTTRPTAPQTQPTIPANPPTQPATRGTGDE